MCIYINDDHDQLVFCFEESVYILEEMSPTHLNISVEVLYPAVLAPNTIAVSPLKL